MPSPRPRPSAKLTSPVESKTDDSYPPNDTAESRKPESTCESIGLVDAMTMIFACRGAMPINTSTPVPRRADSVSADAQAMREDESGSGSRSSSGASSILTLNYFLEKKASPPVSRWSKYEYRKSAYGFHKMDKEALDELAEEERVRRIAQGERVDEAALELKVVKEYEAMGISGSIKETPHASSATSTRKPYISPRIGTRRVIVKLFEKCTSTYAAFEAVTPEKEFWDVMELPFTPSVVDKLAASNHGRSPLNPFVYAAAGLAYPLIEVMRCQPTRSVHSSPYGDFPLSQTDVLGWLNADPELNVVRKTLTARMSPDGAELREIQQGRGIAQHLRSSKVEENQSYLLCKRIQAMLLDECELLSPLMRTVCDVVVARVARMQGLEPKAGEDSPWKDQTPLRTEIIVQFDRFLTAFNQMLARRFYQPCVPYGVTSQGQCVQVLWVTGASSRSIRLLLPLAKQTALLELTSLDARGRARARSRNSVLG